MGQQVRDVAKKAAHVPKKLLPWRKPNCGGPHIAGSHDCFSQGGVWVCKCLKRPVLNFKLLHIFCSQVLEEMLHLSTEKHKIPAEQESAEGGGTGSMWEDHQDVTGYDSVVLIIDKEIKTRDKAKRDESKSDKEAMTKANCMHFEGLGIMPGIISGEGVLPDDMQDNDTSMGMSEDTDENAPQAGETDMRAVIPAGRRKRAAAAAFASRSASEFKELLDSIKGTPEETAAAADRAAEAAEERRIDHEERKAEIARQQIGQDLLLAMLHQMKNGVYSSGRGAVLPDLTVPGPDANGL
ncbi:hypothetical protein B484DRAFT_466407 [Ochromonadaceae sp. CCMP2298]|nr:hypothetical protein B484DRAFT_466407 [Ochromonadaceae sp. CCMP2298]